MKLHIFNPGHDIALAANDEKMTAPHAVRQMQMDLGFIPALWADNSDYILVDDTNNTIPNNGYKRYLHNHKYINWNDLQNINKEKLEVSPWGWDKTIRYKLSVASEGMLDSCMPDTIQLDKIREISGRNWASQNLLSKLLDCDSTCIGKSTALDDYEKLMDVLDKSDNGLAYQYVLKAPWSSSGRGLRYVDLQNEGINEHLQGWIKNVIRKQGQVMIEPYYNKIRDFGMEFTAHKNGEIEYLGLSVFSTSNGAYMGNILAPEDEKEELLLRYINPEILVEIRKTIALIMNGKLKGIYSGPFGIDMMIVNGGKIHPCVELNLRRTMGHVALDLTRKMAEKNVMRMEFNAGHYSLKIKK